MKSQNFYVSERDQDVNDNPSLLIVSKDEKRSFWFIQKDDFWVLTRHTGAKKLSDDYREVRALANATGWPR